MKHRKLLVSLSMLIGAVCLSGDSWKTWVNGCTAQLKQKYDAADSTYNGSIAQAGSHYTQCIDSLACTKGQTTYGCCTQGAYQNNCLPLNPDGSCKNSAAFGSAYAACTTQFCGTGNCPGDPSLCAQGNGGTCCNVYGTETNLAQTAKDQAYSEANKENGTCVAAAPSPCSCSGPGDCSQQNYNISCDQGNACLEGTCQSCPSGSHPCAEGPSCATSCNGSTSQQCAGESCGANGVGYWQCQNRTWVCVDPGSPILIDVTGQGFQLTDAAHGVNFDFFGAGKKVRIAWTVRGSGNAWLVLPDANGMVASGKNMFGNITPQPPSKDPNGFLALAVYDQPANGGNADGVIDERDAIFSKLRLWQDKNHDGISQPDELLTLQQLRVVSISLHYTETKWTDAYGNLFHYRAAIQDAASTRSPQWTYDVFLVIQGAQ